MTIVPQDNAHTLTDVRSPARSTAPGCPSPGPPAWSAEARRQGPRRREDLWPQGKYVTTDLVVTHQVPRRAPRRRQGAPAGRDRRRSTYLKANAGRGAEASSTTASRRSPARRSTRTVLAAAWDNVDFTNDPIASSLRRGRPARRGRRAARPGRPQGHLRPRPAQRAARRGRASRRCKASVVTLTRCATPDDVPRRQPDRPRRCRLHEA